MCVPAGRGRGVGLAAGLQDGRRRAWLLVLVVALWANLHAGAFIGPLLIALADWVCCLKESSLGLLSRDGRSSITPGRRALHPRPHGHAGGSGIFRYLASTPTSSPSIPSTSSVPAWHSDAPLLIYAVALALSFGLCAARRVRPRARDLLPVLGWPPGRPLCSVRGRLRIAGSHLGCAAADHIRCALACAARPGVPGANRTCRRRPARAAGTRASVADVERHGRSWTSISTARICPGRPCVSSTSTACASGCTTTSRPAPFSSGGLPALSRVR